MPDATLHFKCKIIIVRSCLTFVVRSLLTIIVRSHLTIAVRCLLTIIVRSYKCWTIVLVDVRMILCVHG